MAEGHGGSAQTLRDYWSGHGHAGPSHGAERDAIGWGTPGDFMRCVAQVTEHGHMTEEQAKGYCNLRHHEALGYYPATHARMEGKGVDLLTKAADGSDEARVPQGSATGGQFTKGGDGPSKKPKKKNPYAGGKKKSGPGSQRGGGQGGGKAAIRAKIAGLRKKLSGLQALEKSLEAKLPKQQSSGVNSSATDQAAQSETSQSSSSSQSRPNDKGGQTPIAEQLAQVRAQIKRIKQQIKDEQAQLTANKSIRNPRDNPTGRFRTFEGESKEASHAFNEGRITDAVDLLGSARALATEPGHRTTLDQMQRSLSRVQHVVPDVTKSFIRGDSIAHGDKVGFHEGSAGGGHVYLRTRDGVRYRVPGHEVRAARDEENEDLYRQETDPGLPEPPEEKEPAKKYRYRHGWVPLRGDTIVHGDKVGIHDGSAGKGQVFLRDPAGAVSKVPGSEIRPATDEENKRMLNAG